MTTTTATVNAHQKAVPLNWAYWDQSPVLRSLQIPQPGEPFWNQNQSEMPSKRFSILRRPLPTKQPSSSLSDTKPAPEKQKMRPEKLPPLIIPQRQSSHKALLLQMQAVGVPGAVTLRKTSDQSQKPLSADQSHQQLPYGNYQHERVYQPPLAPGRVEEPSLQRVASVQCPVIKPVPIPIPNSPPVPPIPNNHPLNSSATRRLSQVINRARSRSKSRDRRKATKTGVEPETPFLASPPYGTGNTLNLGAPFVHDAPVVVEPETPFLALRLERNIPVFDQEDFLTVLDKKSDGGQPPDSAMTMGSFLSKDKCPPVLHNQTGFAELPARYLDFDEEDARIRLPSQSPKNGYRQSWYASEQQQQQQQQETQRNETLKRSSAVYGGKGGRLSRKDTMSPWLAGNGFSAGGGRPVSLPPWSKTLPPGPRKSGEMDVAEIYARMDPERGGRREREVTPVERAKMAQMVERMDSFSSIVSDETCVAEEQDHGVEWRKTRMVNQHEPEQKLVGEFGEREKAALRELLEYVDSILEPTDTAPVRTGVRCAEGDWSREQGWWRDVRRSLQ